MQIKNLKQIITNSFPDVNIEKIILFGSRARNDFNKDSDYDILIVIKNSISQKEKIRLTLKIRQEFANNLIDADIILKQNKEIEYYKDKIGSVVKNALEEGILL